MLTEIQLIKNCQQGIKSSQYELVRRYAGKLLSVARRYVPDQATAKDILQESLIRIFANIDNYQSTGSFEGWMRTITVRCALAYLRKSHQAHEVEMNPENSPPSVDPSVFNTMGMEELIGLIQQLPDGFRSVFNLREIEGNSHAEIAEILGITESTSRSQLTRAKKILGKLWLKQQSVNAITSQKVRS